MNVAVVFVFSGVSTLLVTCFGDPFLLAGTKLFKCTTGCLSFGPMAQCVVHALKGLANQAFSRAMRSQNRDAVFNASKTFALHGIGAIMLPHHLVSIVRVIPRYPRVPKFWTHSKKYLCFL